MRAVIQTILALFLIAAGTVGGFFAALHLKPEWIALGLASPAAMADAQPMTPAARKPLYYRNPMGLPDTSPTPKKDSMGMDYIAVFADDAPDAADPGVVKVSVDKVQRAGVVSEAAAMRVLTDAIHVPGSVQLDETKLRSITMRAEGYIEQVYAGATGQSVKAGESLFRIYSPQIVQAQIDYRLAAAQGSKEAGSRKLRNLGVPESFIASLTPKGQQPFSLDWPSPVDGVLMSKNVVVGQRVMPGDELYRLADVSTVWVMADVPEQDAGRVKSGDPVTITARALPGEVFTGKINFILPELKAETRTAQVRIELPNHGHRLLHQMYVDVTIDAGRGAPVLSIPASAIIDSGLRKVAIVDLGDGKFKPQTITTGMTGNGYVEVRDGLKPGDKVVTRANFLIDAESNLTSALTALTSDSGAQQ